MWWSENPLPFLCQRQACQAPVPFDPFPNFPHNPPAADQHSETSNTCGKSELANCAPFPLCFLWSPRGWMGEGGGGWGGSLFRHLTRNCRRSHCPAIRSNYALHSVGFCESDPAAQLHCRLTPTPTPTRPATQLVPHPPTPSSPLALVSRFLVLSLPLYDFPPCE